jgi:hypothetical protein
MTMFKRIKPTKSWNEMVNKATSALLPAVSYKSMRSMVTSPESSNVMLWNAIDDQARSFVACNKEL